MKTIAIFSILSTLAIGTQALVPARRWETDPFPSDPKGGAPRAVVTRFKTGSAWDCNSLDQQYVKYLDEIPNLKQGVCNTFPAGTKSIRISEVDPQCRVTVYSMPWCSGSGLEIGVGGCYSNDPLASYKVHCPDKN